MTSIMVDTIPNLDDETKKTLAAKRQQKPVFYEIP